MINTIKQILTAPSDYFVSVKDEIGYKKPWSYFMRLTLIYLTFYLIFTIVFLLISSFIGRSTNPIPTIGFALLFFVIALALVGIGVFVIAFFYHILLLIVGAKNGYNQTFKMYCYAYTPKVFLGPLLIIAFIPIIGAILFWPISMAARIYSMVISVFGAMKLHDLTVIRAIIALVVIPIVLTITLVIVVVVFFIATIIAFTQKSGLTGMAINPLG